MGYYNIDEIFQFALRIEENGEQMYLEFSKKFDRNEKIKEIFIFLSKEEVKHKIFFNNYLTKIKNYEPKDIFPDEYFTYIKSFADNIVFNKEILSKELDKIKTPVDAIEFAMKRELSTIHYFLELKELIDSNEEENINIIIREEKEHFLKLNNLKSEYINLQE